MSASLDDERLVAVRIAEEKHRWDRVTHAADLLIHIDASVLQVGMEGVDVLGLEGHVAPGDLTIVGNWIPFEDPAGGPNFYQFDDNANYYLFGE